jgi:hypothetical protein
VTKAPIGSLVELLVNAVRERGAVVLIDARWSRRTTAGTHPERIYRDEAPRRMRVTC